MLSARPTTLQFEIWLFARPDHREHVRECGAFESEAAAARFAARLRMWLHTGVCSEAMFTNCLDADDRTALLTLHGYLRGRGIDPCLTCVEAIRVPANDNAARAPWESADGPEGAVRLVEPPPLVELSRGIAELDDED